MDFGFGWRDESEQLYGGYIKFNEQEIFKAFESIYGKNPEAEITLQILVNKANTFITAALKTNDPSVVLKENKTNVFKSRKQ